MPRKVTANKQEAAWIAEFETLMERCPDSLWFFSNGHLFIMKRGPNGKQMFVPHGGGVDPDYILDSSVEHIFDGGDW